MIYRLFVVYLIGLPVLGYVVVRNFSKTGTDWRLVYALIFVWPISLLVYIGQVIGAWSSE